MALHCGAPRGLGVARARKNPPLFKSVAQWAPVYARSLIKSPDSLASHSARRECTFLFADTNAWAYSQAAVGSVLRVFRGVKNALA